MSLKKLAAVVVLSSASFSAFAADDMSAGKDFYAQLNAGYAFGVKSSTKGAEGDDYSSNFGKTGKSYSIGLEGGAKVNEFLAVGLGFDYLPGFKAEPNYTSSQTNGSKTKITTMAAFFNVFVNAGEFNGFTPYLVLGAGAAKNKTKDTTFTYGGKDITVSGASKTNFAYKAGLGVKFAASEEIDVDVRYQYVDYGKFKTSEINGTTPSGKLRANQVMLGVAYKF